MKTAVSEKTVFSERFSYISKDMSDVCGRVLGFLHSNHIISVKNKTATL
ncbi:hypothetical protein Osc1_20980 [Hominimerdicola sp. 21CYCFAH17_S]